MSSKDFDKKVVDVLKAARDVSGLAEDPTLMQQLTPEMIKKQAEALETILKTERPADKVKILMKTNSWTTGKKRLIPIKTRWIKSATRKNYTGCKLNC